MNEERRKPAHSQSDRSDPTDPSDQTDPADPTSVVAQLAAERDRLNDQFLRAKAELANYQKRVERDRAASITSIKGDFLAELLPALDALDLAIRHAESIKGSGPFIDGGKEPIKGPDPFIDGVKAARDAFEQALSAQGAERIPAKPGTGYDPDLHHVQATVERADLPEGAIIEELRPGYRLGKLVVRHSSVVVAKRPS